MQVWIPTPVYFPLTLGNFLGCLGFDFPLGKIDKTITICGCENYIRKSM